MAIALTIFIISLGGIGVLLGIHMFFLRTHQDTDHSDEWSLAAELGFLFAPLARGLKAPHFAHRMGMYARKGAHAGKHTTWYVVKKTAVSARRHIKRFVRMLKDRADDLPPSKKGSVSFFLKDISEHKRKVSHYKHPLD